MDKTTLKQLVERYEQASGNTVHHGTTIVNSSGMYVGPFSPELAEEYLSATDEEEAEWLAEDFT